MRTQCNFMMQQSTEDGTNDAQTLGGTEFDFKRTRLEDQFNLTMSNLGEGMEGGGFLNESSMTTRDFAKNQSMSLTHKNGEFKV